MAVGRLLSPTVTIENLESGGGISIRVSNQPELTKDINGNTVVNTPADADMGSPHNTLGAVTTDTGGGLGGAFTWVRAVKTAGGSPKVTYVAFQAQQAK